MTDPLELQVGPPPRQVEVWTRVAGHQMAGPTPARRFCSCGGWRGEDGLGTEAEHLAAAWPIPVVKESGEGVESYLARCEASLGAAQMALEDAEAAAGMGRPIPPGHEYPVITSEIMDLAGRVEVLGHQVEELRERFGRPGH